MSNRIPKIILPEKLRLELKINLSQEFIPPQPDLVDSIRLQKKKQFLTKNLLFRDQKAKITHFLDYPNVHASRTMFIIGMDFIYHTGMNE